MASRKSDLLDWLKALVIAFVLVFLVKTFLFSPIIVDGPSMQPTLHDRDQMIVNKLLYRFKEPDRFDIVVFHATSQKDFIKRVIGLPNEHVMVLNGELYINGEQVEEPFLTSDNENLPIVTYDFRLEDLPGGHKVIPEGYVLVLGDNRPNSTDSRTIGLIPIDEIVGKANLIYWPINRIQYLSKIG